MLYLSIDEFFKKFRFRQNVSAKIMVSRELRRRNFGNMDHKRKAWWTITSLENERHEKNCNKYYSDLEQIASKEWRTALQQIADNHRAAQYSEFNQFESENKNSKSSFSTKIKYWLNFLIKIVLSFGIVLGMACNHQFGKEYSSCNAGDGPPMENINNSRLPPIDTSSPPVNEENKETDRSRPRSISWSPGSLENVRTNYIQSIYLLLDVNSVF